MLYTTNADVPGIIGLLGTICGDAGVNIANFQLGRDQPGGDAIALLYLDARSRKTCSTSCAPTPAIRQAKPLVFNVD